MSVPIRLLLAAVGGLLCVARPAPAAEPPAGDAVFVVLRALAEGDPGWSEAWAAHGLSRDDDAEHAAMFLRLRQRVPAPPAASPRANPWAPARAPARHADHLLASWLLEASSPDELESRAQDALGPDDASALAAAAEAFWSRAAAWQEAHASERTALGRWMTERDLAETLGQAARFLGVARTDDPAIAVHLVASPGDLAVERIGRHVLVLLPEGADPVEASARVVTAAVEHTWEVAGLLDDPALADLLFEPDAPGALRAWRYLPDAVPVAVGRGAWLWRAAPDELERRAGAPGWLHPDPPVDGYAARILPELAAAMASARDLRSIREVLVGAALATLEGPIVDRLHVVGVASPHAGSDWFDREVAGSIRGRHAPHGWSAFMTFERRDRPIPWTSGFVIVIATWDELAALRPDERRRYGAPPAPTWIRDRIAIWSRYRPGGGQTMVVAAPDVAALRTATSAVLEAWAFGDGWWSIPLVEGEWPAPLSPPKR